MKYLLNQNAVETHTGEDATGITNNAPHSRIVATEVTKSNEDIVKNTAVVAGAGLIAELIDLGPFYVYTLVVKQITTSIDVVVSADGTNYSTNIQVKDVSDGVYKAITALGVYEIQIQCESMKFTAVGAGPAELDWIIGAK